MPLFRLSMNNNNFVDLTLDSDDEGPKVSNKFAFKHYVPPGSQQQYSDARGGFSQGTSIPSTGLYPGTGIRRPILAPAMATTSVSTIQQESPPLVQAPTQPLFTLPSRSPPKSQMHTPLATLALKPSQHASFPQTTTSSKRSSTIQSPLPPIPQDLTKTHPQLRPPADMPGPSLATNSHGINNADGSRSSQQWSCTIRDCPKNGKRYKSRRKLDKHMLRRHKRSLSESQSTWSTLSDQSHIAAYNMPTNPVPTNLVPTNPGPTNPVPTNPVPTNPVPLPQTAAIDTTPRDTLQTTSSEYTRHQGQAFNMQSGGSHLKSESEPWEMDHASLLYIKMQEALRTEARNHKQWLPEEDELLLFLKEVLEMSWASILSEFFPHRVPKHNLRNRYTRLKKTTESQRIQSQGVKRHSSPRIHSTPDLVSHDEGERRSSKRLKTSGLDERNLYDPKLYSGYSHVVRNVETRDADDCSTQIPNIKSASYNRQHISSARDLDPVRHSNITSLVPPILSRTTKSLAPFLRARELGKDHQLNSRGLKSKMLESLGPNLSFSTTSGDVISVAWAPNGTRFAVGSAALIDTASMQYNMPNNLLCGNLESKRIYELPHHMVSRPLPETGANSTREMFASQDPFLFTTVSSVQYFRDGNRMISTGFDGNAMIWNTKEDSVDCPKAPLKISHEGLIDVLAVSQTDLFATGVCKPKNPSTPLVRIFKEFSEEFSEVHNFSPTRTTPSSEKAFTPSCLKFNKYFRQQYGHLLCGFSANVEEDNIGAVCLFDVETGASQYATCNRGVFDIAWSPSVFGRFIVGCARGQKVSRGTRSVVRMYDSTYLLSKPIQDRYSINANPKYELECPALDMNDVIFNPHDDNLISAGCTNGSTYIWDLRRHDKILHVFEHGPGTLPLDHLRSREEIDTGVRFLSWDHCGRTLFSGSSDGILASWDPYRSPEDAHTGDIIQVKSGIMSGAFNSDHSDLILGEVNGTVSILSVGHQDNYDGEVDVYQFDRLTLVEDKEEKEKFRELMKSHSGTTHLPNSEESGIELGNQLIQSGKINLRPMGSFPARQAVQGPFYDGPFDKSGNAFMLREKAAKFQQELEPGPNICLLNHDIPKLTEEGSNDSQQWKGRIPQRTNGRLIPITACFRCGIETLLSSCSQSDVLTCLRCGLEWEADVLGYTLLATDSSRKRIGFPDKVEWNSNISRHIIDVEGLSVGLDDISVDFSKLSTFDDPVYNIQDHYHSLWHERPPSPL